MIDSLVDWLMVILTHCVTCITSVVKYVT